MIAKVAKIVGWTLGGLIALVVVLYLVLLAINWKDREPSGAAIRLDSQFRERPAVTDSDNAYVFLLGFAVPPNEDPFAMGVKRKEWLETAAREYRLDLKEDPLQASYQYDSKRTPAMTALVEQCRSYGDAAKCAIAFSEQDTVLQEWATLEGWLFDRYLLALDRTEWRESPYFESTFLPQYQHLLEGQRQLLIRAKFLAKENNLNGAKQLLEKDLKFWRMTLRSSDILISKMIAVAAINRHFELGNVVLRQLPLKKAMEAMPDGWQAALSDEERSMRRCLIGEWKFSSQMIKGLLEKERKITSVYGDDDPGMIDSITNRLMIPLYQYQDTVNKSAEHLSAILEAIEVPLDRMVSGLEKAQALDDTMASNAFPPKSAFNLPGNILLGMAGTYLPYAKRVADLEGIRRAALATVLLRQKGVKPDQVATELQTSELRNPYNNEPFAWDEEKRSVVFTGLTEGNRRIHSFLY